MHIGMIGGIGPAATDYYYQTIINAFEKENRQLELTMAHASSRTLLKNLAADNASDQVEIYHGLAERLKAAGSDFLVVTSIAGHFCIEQFKQVSPLPVIDMVSETSKAVSGMGYDRIGILGTRTVMENRFYGGIQTAEVIPPEDRALDLVHDAYVAMAASGSVTDEQREVFSAACERLFEVQNADAIMLGGTDLALVYQEDDTEFPVIDCAAIHCRAVIEQALNDA